MRGCYLQRSTREGEDHNGEGGMGKGGRYVIFHCFGEGYEVGV